MTYRNVIAICHCVIYRYTSLQYVCVVAISVCYCEMCVPWWYVFVVAICRCVLYVSLQYVIVLSISLQYVIEICRCFPKAYKCAVIPHGKKSHNTADIRKSQQRTHNINNTGLF